MKIIELIILLIALITFCYGLARLVSIKKEISSIKQRKTFYFVIANIAAALLFTLINIALLVFVIYDMYSPVMLLASITSLLTSVFIVIVCIVTKEIGKLIYTVNSLRNLDSFTKIYNRGYMEKAILSEFNRCIRYKRKSCLMMFDINKFKLINDTFGHQAGDKVILELVNILQKNIRNTDILGRYGGDEFIVLMPETNIASAEFLKDRITQDVSHSAVTHDYLKIIYSVSIGLLEIDLNFTTYAQWINRVDTRLYADKNRAAI